MRSVNVIFEELDYIAYMVKESNTQMNYDLVYEGFWDTVKKGVDNLKTGAHKVGEFGANVRNTAVKGYNAVKGGIDYVKELGQRTWDKIKELGEDFVEWVKEVKEKTLGLIEEIKGLPAKAWDKLISFWGWLGELINKIGDKIKTGWETFKNIMSTFVFKPIANAVRNFIINTEVNISYYSGLLAIKYMDAESAMRAKKNAASERIGEILDTIIAFFKKLPGKGKEALDFLAKLGKNIVIIALGLVILPFYLVGQASKYLYELGETFLDKIIEVTKVNYASAKRFVDEQLAQLKDATSGLKDIPGEVKAGYQSVQKVQVRESYKHILPYNRFNS